MVWHGSYSLLPTRADLGWRWLVLIIMVLGILVSSIGSTVSHGVAAITAEHRSQRLSPDLQEHEHTNQGELIAAQDSASLAHPHHAIDHSHDKAHAPPAAWRCAPSLLSSWQVNLQPWIEMVQASRLERPPMG